MCVGQGQGSMQVAQNREPKLKQKQAYAWRTDNKDGRLVTYKGIGQRNIIRKRAKFLTVDEGQYRYGRKAKQNEL